MIIVLKQHAPADKVEAFCKELNGMGYQINDSVGSDTHILGLIGDTKALAESWVLANPVVETCRRVSEPYKKANRKFHPDDTVVDVGGHKIGGGYFAVMSGPCSVESKEQITFVAQRVQAAGASILRGGAFKPRTSPYSFQGLRAEGLELLQEARAVTGQPIVTELMNNEHIPLFLDAKVDMIQIGARNMQNFELLKAVGKLDVPVLLKRGLSGRDRPEPRCRHRLYGARTGTGRRGSRCGRPDDRDPQRPRQGQERWCPEPDPRPVRHADGHHQAGTGVLWENAELSLPPRGKPLRADASIGPYTKTKIAAALFPGSRDFFIAYTIFSSAGGQRS